MLAEVTLIMVHVKSTHLYCIPIGMYTEVCVYVYRYEYTYIYTGPV